MRFMARTHPDYKRESQAVGRDVYPHAMAHAGS